MKRHFYFLFLASLFLANASAQTCSSSFIFSYTGINNSVWFQDHSSAPLNFTREYTHWNFKDGSAIDTGKALVHTFPQALNYNVVKETKFSEIGNPSNFCIAKDSLTINAALSTSTNVCIPGVNFKVKWLTGLTFGVSNYISNGCPYNFREIVGDTGSAYMPAGHLPMPGIFTTQQYYFTYTITLPQFSNTITHHINYPNPNNFDGSEDYHQIISLSSSHQTPTNCHASFFMLPSDSSMHNWTIQDFSSSSDSLSYNWDFGDGNTSTLSAPNHTYSSIGMYTVCLTVSSGTCSDTYCETAYVDSTINGQGIQSISVQKMIIAGLVEKTNKPSILSIFPNPASNSINISYPFKSENYTVIITNTLGEITFNKSYNNLSSNTLNINVNNFNRGIYFVQLKSETGQSIAKTKFIKE
jgi:PKD repeat protein